MKINTLVGESEGSVIGPVVLIDVFRSSTTIVTALSNGCRYVRPFKSIERAKKSKEREQNDKEIILVGEDTGRMPSGFDFNISPTGLLEQDIEGKIIFYRSSNLTRVLKSYTGADEIIIGGLINAKRIADYLKEKGSENVTIVACGVSREPHKEAAKEMNLSTFENFSELTVEDLMGAGAIAGYLEGDHLSDLTLISILAHSNSNWKKLTKKGFIPRYLRKVGYERDIEYCLKKNHEKTVPVFKDEKIVTTEQI